MRYSSINRIHDFELHDAQLSLISWQEKCLVVCAKHLNIHKDAANNNYGADMEISEARITFSSFEIKELEPSRAWKKDENGNLYTDDPLIIHTGTVARELFEKELLDSITVMGIKLDNGMYELCALGIEPCFFVRFSVSQIEIEWDSYSKKAWYEQSKQYKKELTLAKENDEFKVGACITCKNEDVNLNCGDKIEAPSVTVAIEYGTQMLCGYGKDYLWADAFADLQKNLPNKVKMRCCMTCRHGNMCPVGNKPGELFCTKDVSITQKSDLFFYTENETERAKRSRDCTDVCESYQEQTSEHYTYNDYVNFLINTTKIN